RCITPARPWLPVLSSSPISNKSWALILYALNETSELFKSRRLDYFHVSCHRLRNRSQGGTETELCGLLEARLGPADWSNLTRQAGLAECNKTRRQGYIEDRRHKRGGHSKVGGRLRDLQPAGDIQINVSPCKAEPAAGFEHREHHGEAARVPAHDGATRRAE